MAADPRHCADLILAAFHNDDDWQSCHEPHEVEAMQRDVAAGLSQVFRHLAEISAPVAAFELEMLANEFDPDLSSAADPIDPSGSDDAPETPGPQPGNIPSSSAGCGIPGAPAPAAGPA